MRMHRTISRFTLAGLLTILLAACASQIPLAIRSAPPGSPSLEQVRAQVGPGYLGRQVRFGGILIETLNEQDVTRLTILGRPLTRDGEPEYTDDSAGRFIAIIPGFLDPEVYAPERAITITGTLVRNQTGTVGEFPYTFPVVEATDWYLWPKQLVTPYGYHPWHDPWYYRPWYDPWHPFGYPYRYWP